MKFTQIPVSTFENLQLNAGILVDAFDPATLESGSIIGATTGGITFTDNVSYSDFGDDIDNCPKNMLELKKLDSHEVTMSGTLVSVDAGTVKLLAAAADIGADDITIIPRNDLLTSDFKTVWWVGDYSDHNDGAGAGFMAIKLMNALNTGGFQIRSTDRGKGQLAFSFMGHYSMAAQDVVPYEIYVKQGSGTVQGSISFQTHSVELEEGDTFRLIPTVTPTDAEITWTTGSSSVATVDGETFLVTAEGEGNTIITASITVGGVTYNDTCTVVVTAGE